MKTAQEVIELLGKVPPNANVMVGVPQDSIGNDIVWVEMDRLLVHRWPGCDMPNPCIVARPFVKEPVAAPTEATAVISEIQ